MSIPEKRILGFREVDRDDCDLVVRPIITIDASMAITCSAWRPDVDAELGEHHTPGNAERVARFMA
jgi:hypothetical protein